jgi:LacI family transcriptional regulator
VIGLVCVEHVGLSTGRYDIESVSPLFNEHVLDGIRAVIRDGNWSVLITRFREDGELDLRRLLSLPGKVDGLLIAEGIVPSPVVARLARQLPVVLIAGDADQRAADVVMVDNRAGTAALVAHLLEDHGKRRLFHVDGPPVAPDARERRRALNEVLSAHPGSELVGTYGGHFNVRSGEAAGAHLLAARGRLFPDAVVCANDLIAFGMLRALGRAGVRVPEDVAVVGFDGYLPGNTTEPALTTVYQPMQLLGQRSCARLLHRIAQPGLPQQVEVLPTELVLRTSCGCPPSAAARRPIEPQFHR